MWTAEIRKKSPVTCSVVFAGTHLSDRGTFLPQSNAFFPPVYVQTRWQWSDPQPFSQIDLQKIYIAEFLVFNHMM